MMIAAVPGAAAVNDRGERARHWRRFAGDDWNSFDSLPPVIRRRLCDHAYDAWSVNALMVWQRYRRHLGDEGRAERAMLRYLDHLERQERRLFAASQNMPGGAVLPHDRAAASVLRATAGRG
ncbi:DUF6525 family protein [Rhizosaccharibacter radicis]|uniref:DUF6525 family protein n=1 Tax=Rhizosaccharibacter radicis TaxID=2782605 RepID=A0ABT1VZS5_9PROT|nr:DUF6525 family protein [Acetobacteraceae bacterium KSS12]